MGGIDGYGIAGEPSWREREELEARKRGERHAEERAATICRVMANKSKSPAVKRALRKAANEIEDG